MILHLVTDEKFTDYAIAHFSALEIESEFILVPSNNMMEYVKLIDKCVVIRYWDAEFNNLLNRLDQYTGIIFHGLFWGRWQTLILQRVPSHVKVAWHFWGGDIYARQDVVDQFFAPITKSLCKLRSQKRNSRDTEWEIPLDLFKRVNYCLTSIHEEFDFARTYTGAKFEHLWYACYTLEETIGSLMDKHCEGNNIWIGNSAAPENNHLDVLWKIGKSGLLRRLKNEQVIIPLSYGAQWMRNVVIKVARLLFGKRLRALTDYMPREEYNALMLSCSTMIIGYWEPAGQGNIITALWLGMRVYISERSMTYAFFNRIGAKVFSIESDMKKYQFAPLPEEERALNREVLRKWYGKQHVMEAVQNVVYALQ